MIIEINTITGLITIQENEKGENLKTAPIKNPPIQYNPIDIKRKYYKKWDPEYHRKPFKPISKFLKSDKTVKQEPLLDPCY